MSPALLDGFLTTGLPEKSLCYFCKNNDLKSIHSVSGLQQGDSDMCVIDFFRFFSTVGFYKILKRVPCAIQ